MRVYIVNLLKRNRKVSLLKTNKTKNGIRQVGTQTNDYALHYRNGGTLEVLVDLTKSSKPKTIQNIYCNQNDCHVDCGRDNVTTRSVHGTLVHSRVHDGQDGDRFHGKTI